MKQVQPTLRCIWLLLAVLGIQAVAAQTPAPRTLRIIAFGAHPDDAEQKFGGTAALFAAQGHKVKLVALTNGDVGHFSQAGGPLAQRRKAEVEACHKKLGVETDVLDIHDGELMPDLETRKKVVNLIRDWQADIVLSHRPWDYHPDHRAVGKLAEDAAVIAAAPFFAPYTPPTKRNPIFLFYSDGFQKPYPFDPIIAVGFDDVAEKKWACIGDMPSQFADADSWQARYRGNAPTDAAARAAFILNAVKQRSADVANQYRNLLVKLYGERKGGAIKYAEAFELNQYGSPATADELKQMFPTFR
ncbi:MAG TPA: PIG-L family deacetylase [Vicinamibacterales bacterium]|nr:PIG-L family deacetylase [Vicinamibacterales bacterium]